MPSPAACTRADPTASAVFSPPEQNEWSARKSHFSLSVDGCLPIASLTVRYSSTAHCAAFASSRKAGDATSASAARRRIFAQATAKRCVASLPRLSRPNSSQQPFIRHRLPAARQVLRRAARFATVSVCQHRTISSARASNVLMIACVAHLPQGNGPVRWSRPRWSEADVVGETGRTISRVLLCAATGPAGVGRRTSATGLGLQLGRRGDLHGAPLGRQPRRPPRTRAAWRTSAPRSR